MALGSRDEDDRICVNATAMCTSEEQVAKVGEAFARVVTGLALEGINLNMGYILVRPDDAVGPYGPVKE